MYKLILFLGICSAFSLGSKLPAKQPEKLPAREPVPDSEKIVACYYYVWTELILTLHYDNFDIQDINVSLCTHIIYNFIEFKPDASIESFTSDKDGENAIKRFNDLRKKKPNLKTIVTLGNSHMDTGNYTKVANDPILRKKFVNNVVAFVKKYDFNGVDINWQLPVQVDSDGVPSDKPNFVLLLKGLREKFDKEGLILFATVRAVEDIAKVSYDIKAISANVNFINLMTYEFYEYDQADKKVTHNAPLYPSPKESAEERTLNIDYVVKYWLSQGAPPSKLILGITFGGVGFTLANPKKVGRGAPFIELGKIGDIGYMPQYYETCRLLKDPKWKHLYDKDQQVPYIYKGNKLLAYDDVESIKKKAEYAKQMNLGGVSAYSIQEDDFNGHCGEKHPLLKTLNRVFGNKC